MWARLRRLARPLLRAVVGHAAPSSQTCRISWSRWAARSTSADPAGVSGDIAVRGHPAGGEDHPQVVHGGAAAQQDIAAVGVGGGKVPGSVGVQFDNSGPMRQS